MLEPSAALAFTLKAAADGTRKKRSGAKAEQPHDLTERQVMSLSIANRQKAGREIKLPSRE